MSAIDEIRKEVVEFLLERHEQEKAAGREFYFKVELADPNSIYSFLIRERENTSELSAIHVYFYGAPADSPIAFLYITQSRNVYLIGRLREQDPLEGGQVFEDLRDYFREVRSHLRKYLAIMNRPYRRSMPGDFLSIWEFDRSLNITESLSLYLSKVKPDINKMMAPLRGGKYAYFFLNREQFEEYLKTEPFYSIPKPPVKRDLALRYLHVRDFRGIKQIELNDLPESANWIVLTGMNGYGKTSVLQAIAAGLSGNYDDNNPELVPGSAFVSVEYYSGGETVEINSRTPRSEATLKRLGNELATYGSSRLQVMASVSKETLEQQAPTTYNLFNSDGPLLNIEQLLKDTYHYDNELFNRIQDLFKALLPNLAKIEIITINRLPEIRYYEQDEAGRLLNDGMPFSQLASGLKNIIAMIGDMVYRLSVRQDVDNFSELEGIVIIDELEIHLHPKLQKRLPALLTEYFPRIQFIASTHSPIPLLGVPKDTVLLNVTRSEERGIEVERLDVDFSILTPNAILSSPIFGFQDLIPDSKSDTEMVRSESLYSEVVKQDETRAQIDSFLSPERQKELLQLLKSE